MKYKTLNEIALEKVSHNEDIYKQVLLRNNEIPHITNFARATLKKNQQIEKHVHADMFETFFIIEGSGRANINSESFDLKPGVCIIIEPNDAHSFVCTSDKDLVMLYFAVVE
jgi:quercetin dioxygenase-like cupin family protein